MNATKENTIPLDMAYLWAYVDGADECETAGPTLYFYNEILTAEERSQIFQEYGEEANSYLPPRLVDFQIH